MKRSLLIFTVLILFFNLPQAFGAETAKIKFVTSIYADAEGGGLRYPKGVGCGKNSLLVADTDNSRVIQYIKDEEGYKAEKVFPLNNAAPIGVQENSKGDIYVLDGRQRRIARINEAGEIQEYVAPKGQPNAASNMIPKSFRIASDDNLYILDIFGGQVLIVNPQSQYVSHIPFPEQYGFFSDLTVDSRGNVFLIDSVKSVVYSAKKGEDHFTALTSSLKQYVNFPTSLAIDSRGLIYVVDQNGGGVAVLAQDGTFLGRKIGMGWSEGLLNYPSQICINKDGIIFIADRSNSRVEVFALVEK